MSDTMASEENGNGENTHSKLILKYIERFLDTLKYEENEEGSKEGKTNAPEIASYEPEQKFEETLLKGELLFRGQSDCSWEIQSSAKRRLNSESVVSDPTVRNDFVAEKDFVKYHLDMIDTAPSVSDKAGHELQGLNLLAQIQHYGGATLLTDFSRNFFVALWFASETCKEECPQCNCPYSTECKSLSKGKCIHGGRVFIIDTKAKKNKVALLRIKKSELKSYHVEDVLFYTARTEEKEVKPYTWLWEPEAKENDRIRAQSSVFLFGLSNFDKNNMAFTSFVVDEGDKANLRGELKAVLNISAETLFPDIAGFSEAVN